MTDDLGQHRIQPRVSLVDGKTVIEPDTGCKWSKIIIITESLQIIIAIVTDKDTIADIETADICASVVALRLEQPYRV